MKKTKNTAVLKNGNKLHKQQCRIVSKQLEAKYEKLGLLQDGMLKIAILELVENHKAEEALLACDVTVRFIQELCKRDKGFRNLLDQKLLNDNVFGENINAIEAINCLHRFHSRIFNFFTPGWIDMHRLVSKPEIFTGEDLDYLQTVFVEDEFAKGFDKNK